MFLHSKTHVHVHLRSTYSSQSMAVPSYDELRSAPFLARVLEDASISDVSLERLSGGLAGDVTRVHVIRSQGGGSPTSVVVKSHAVVEAGRVDASALGLAREALFLSSPLAVRLAAVLAGALPKVFFAAGDMASGLKAIVLEDVAVGVQAGRFFGPGSPLNWGSSPPSSAELDGDAAPSPADVTRAAFLVCARWHRAFAGDRALLSADTAPFLRGAAALGGRAAAAEKEWRAAQTQAANSWSNYEASLAGGAIPANLQPTPRLLNLVRASLARAVWPDAAAAAHTRAATGNFTLVHGDMHPANCLWLSSSASENRGSRLVVLDFEAVGVGSGAQDLAQFVISHMTPADRRACERGLLREYVDAFASASGAPGESAARSHSPASDYDSVSREYAAGGSERWVWLLALLAGMCPPAMVAFWASQLDAFCEDWGVTADNIGMPRV